VAKSTRNDDLDVHYDEDQPSVTADESVLDFAAPALAEAKAGDAKSVDITPDVSLIQKSGQTGYRVSESLAEFNDNSVDNKTPGIMLVIENVINRDRQSGGRITVTDNGSGMNEEALEKSMVMAHSTKTGDKIGMFGMGMKTAASNLGKRFAITTCTAEMDHGLQLKYNEDEFIAGGKWEVAIVKVPKPFDYGTRIDITNLRVSLYGELVNVVSRNLAANFKHFIDDGSVLIKVNGVEVKPEEPDLMPGYTKDFAFDLNGKVVRGWAGIATKGSQRGRYGFDLIRHNRIVSRYQKIGFTPHPALAWIRGELFLDGFMVTNNKREFVRDTEEWDKLADRVSEEIKDVIRNSRKRAVKNLPARETLQADQFAKEIERVSSSNELRSDVRVAVLDTIGDEPAIPVAAPTGRAKADKPGKKRDPDNVVPIVRPLTPRDAQNKADRIVTELLGVKILHETASLGLRMPYFESTVDEKVGETVVHVVTNLDHPVYRNINTFDLGTRVKENIVEALAIHLCEKNGVDSIEDFITWKSQILKRHAQMVLGQENDEAEAVDTMLG
jgi:hypothetical protein